MTQAKAGSTVQVHFSCRKKDGVVFDSSRQRDPLEFQLGAGEVIAGIEQALEGMSPGDCKTVELGPAETYGERQPEKIFDLPRRELPADAAPQVGQKIELQTPEGQVLGAVVSQVNDSTITVDANHPLAGESLVFDLQLVGIV